MSLSGFFKFSLFFCLLLLLMATARADDGIIPIYQVDVPCSINKSGSYIVAENLHGLGLAGSSIIVSTNDVTIDLGYNSVGGTLLAPAIRQFAGLRNMVVKNGTIMRGINASGSQNRFENLTIHYGYSDALATGPNSVVKQCILTSNNLASAYALVRAGSGSYISDCYLVDNDGQGELHSIVVGNGATVENCFLSDGSASNSVTAIESGDDCIIDAVTIRNYKNINMLSVTSVKSGDNTIVNESFLQGTVTLGDGCLLTDCSFSTQYCDTASYISSIGNGSIAVKNFLDKANYSSFYINNGSLMMDNYCGSEVNGGNGSMIACNHIEVARYMRANDVILSYDCYLHNNRISIGVVLTNSCNRVDHNHLFNSVGSYQLKAYAGDNLIIRNRFMCESTSFVTNGSDDHIGKKVDQTEITTDQPWANLQAN
jgi:hypothetical protein